MLVNIKGLDKARVLLALWRRSHKQGLGLFTDDAPLTLEECREMLKTEVRFDYLRGRVMKVRLDGDALDPRAYDRDNGQGAAAGAIIEEFSGLHFGRERWSSRP